MKAADFSNVLIALSEFTTEEAARIALHDLATVFAGSGKQTVAAICKRLQGLQPEPDVSGWSRATLAKHLSHAQALFAKAGAKSAADDFSSVVACLQTGGAGSVNAWTQQALSLLSDKPARKARPPKKSVPGASDDTVVVDSYVRRLQDAGWNQALFNAVVEEIKADKTARVSAVRRIGEQFAQLRTAGLTKPKVLLALREDFVSRLRTRNELDVVAKTKPW